MFPPWTILSGIFFQSCYYTRAVWALLVPKSLGTVLEFSGIGTIVMKDGSTIGTVGMVRAIVKQVPNRTCTVVRTTTPTTETSRWNKKDGKEQRRHGGEKLHDDGDDDLWYDLNLQCPPPREERDKWFYHETTADLSSICYSTQARDGIAYLKLLCALQFGVT
jgi:hypothetical protein